ncbi:hypothetical protein DAPPUDRAFT_241481 [Daphnia pulex]|uniref:RING-type domain-containing protein n=1 Tax=Daphnia pulex TaxID=6669 RepID=E9GEC8_DAPPU|nr:hypothetical protein DAPPUDRAFT_241481 [Daphnia pulex]|eukprot:EFX82240.1 hypothetical protein DAPPUDRAFT_241481 [Daphnia pulex]
MAAASDVEDFITCGVCFCEYDHGDRKPKFLQCSHTVCLSCLKGIRHGDTIACPFCRDTFVKFDVESLPNNAYAFYLLKLKEKNVLPKLSEIVTTPLAVSWCLTCGSAEKRTCTSSGHSSVEMTADAIRNVEELFKLKEELMKMKNIGTNQLATAIQERQKVHEQLALLLNAIRCSENEIKKLRDENSFHLAQMMTLLERNSQKSSSDGQPKEKLYFSELMSFVEGSTADDTAETLKQKMTKSVEWYEQQCHEAMAIASEYELRKKFKIAVHLYDENDRRIPTVPWLEEGFRFQPLCPALKGSQLRQNSLLLSHAVFSLLQSNVLNREVPTVGAESKGEQPTPVVHFPPSISLTSTKKFVLNASSFFILRIYQSGTLIGNIVIRPVHMFEHCDFTRQLGEFCFQTQKVISGVYVEFPMANAEFQPVVPKMESFDAVTRKPRNVKTFADQLDEVGVTFFKSLFDQVIGWSFIFPLEDFRSPKNEANVKKVSANELFGRVTDRFMMEPVIKLSSANKSERAGYTITVESQSPL